MNILIIGSGGREHTFAWKVKQSKRCTGLFVAPGNSGTDAIATNLNIAVTDFDEIKNAVIQNNIELAFNYKTGVFANVTDPLYIGTCSSLKAMPTWMIAFYANKSVVD